MDEQNNINQTVEEAAPEVREDPSADGESMEMMDLNELVEESLKSIQEGEVVQGTVVQVSKEHVVVDVGYKSEGQISIQEFLDDQGDVAVQEGDQVEVLLEKWENEEGNVILSKEKAAKIKVWDEIRKAYNENQSITGVILARVKGGFTVELSRIVI